MKKKTNQKKEKVKKEEFLDELQYNQGDKDLEPYFVPRAKAAGGIIPTPDINKLRRAHRQGILTVMGVRLFSALIGDDWKMREAAVRAFLDYIENPLLPRYIALIELPFLKFTIQLSCPVVIGNCISLLIFSYLISSPSIFCFITIRA